MFMVELPSVPPQETPVMLVRADAGRGPDIRLERGNGLGRQMARPAPVGSAAPSLPPVVMVANATSGQQTSTERLHIVGSCELLNLNKANQVNAYPVIAANAYFAIAANDYPKAHYARIVDDTAKITVIQRPKHGQLEPTNLDGDWTDTRYLPNDGYLGKDFFVLQVEGDGYRVKLHYFVLVTEDDGVQANPACKTPGYWKISLPTTPVEPSDVQSLLTYTGISGPGAGVSSNNETFLLSFPHGQTTQT